MGSTIAWDTEMLQPFFNKITHQIGHNWVFDARVMNKYDIDVRKPKLFDTMIAHHLLDENGRHGLKHLVRSILDREVQDFEEGASHYNKRFYKYGLEDAINTYDLYKELLPLILEDYKTLFFDVEMPFQLVLLEMALTGVEVDEELIYKQEKVLVENEQFLLTRLCEESDTKYEMQFDLKGGMNIIPSSNFNSSHFLAEKLVEKGVKLVDKTETGAWKVGTPVLKKIKGNDFVDLVLRYKIVSKLLSGFIRPLPSFIQEDGKVRPNFKDTGTKTGRLSSSKPNLQQLSKPKCYKCGSGKVKDNVCEDCGEKVEVNIRSIYTVPKGYKMFSADYSGQEIAVMAHLSEDDSMLESLHKGYDLHLTIANQFKNLGIPKDCLSSTHPDYEGYKSKFGKERGESKMITFGLAYGKAQTLDSNVLTPTGWTTFKDIKEGDSVFSADGSVTKVSKVHPIQKQPTYEIEMMDGSKTKCGEEHLWTIRTHYDRLNNKSRTIPLHELKGILKKGEQNNCSIDYCKPLKFSTKEQYLHPYLMGLYLGDGDTLSRLTIENKAIVEKVKTLIPSGLQLNKHGKYHYAIVPIKRYSDNKNPLKTYMRSIGLEGKIVYNKSIPKQYLYGDVNQRVELFKGLFDSDGSFNNNCYDYTSVSKDLIEDVSFLVKSLGGRCSITSRYTHYTYKGVKKRGRLAYRAFISFGEYQQTNTIKSITYIGEEECRCITIDREDGLYITDDFIVTHNSAYGFAQDFGITEDEAQKIVDDYFAGVPKLLQAIEDTHAQLKKDGYVTSMAGRRRHFNKEEKWMDYSKGDYRQSFNFLIQGFSADMIRMAANKVYFDKKEEWGLKQIMTVHDELVFQVKEEYLVEATNMVKDSMENILPDFKVPLVADIEVGDNYGNSK